MCDSGPYAKSIERFTKVVVRFQPVDKMKLNNVITYVTTIITKIDVVLYQNTKGHRLTKIWQINFGELLRKNTTKNHWRS